MNSFEKILIIKEIAKGKTTKSISERINLHVVTEIGDSEKIFKKSFIKKPWSDRGGLNDCVCVR